MFLTLPDFTSSVYISTGLGNSQVVMLVCWSISPSYSACLSSSWMLFVKSSTFGGLRVWALSSVVLLDSSAIALALAVASPLGLAAVPSVDAIGGFSAAPQLTFGVLQNFARFYGYLPSMPPYRNSHEFFLPFFPLSLCLVDVLKIVSLSLSLSLSLPLWMYVYMT